MGYDWLASAALTYSAVRIPQQVRSLPLSTGMRDRSSMESRTGNIFVKISSEFCFLCHVSDALSISFTLAMKSTHPSQCVDRYMFTRADSVAGSVVAPALTLSFLYMKQTRLHD